MSVLATLAYSGFVAGQVFDNAADGANVLEIGGPDMASIASYSSTAAWLLGLVVSERTDALFIFFFFSEEGGWGGNFVCVFWTDFRLGLAQSATFLSWVKQVTGSWRALFLLPVLSRAMIACFWAARCSARPAREYVVATGKGGGETPGGYLRSQHRGCARSAS